MTQSTNSPDRDVMLAALVISPEEIVRAEPLAGGLSGSRVTRLTLARTQPSGATAYASRILKEVRPRDGWLGILSDDRDMREVALREWNIFQNMPRGIDTATEKWMLNGGVPGTAWGALLMRDERGHLLRDPLRMPPGRMPSVIVFVLDRLAQLHARFWNDVRVTDPEPGVMYPDASMLLYAPARIAERIAAGDPAEYLPLAAAGWEAFFRIAPSDAAATLREVFDAPKRWIQGVDNMSFTLLHGDVWGPNLGILPPTRIVPRLGRRLLLLDWALAAAGPATFDPLSLCGAWHTLDPVRLLAVYRARLNRYLGARDITLSHETWRALSEAGYLRTALTCGEAFGRAAALATAAIMRQRAEARVRWWARRGAAAAHWLAEHPQQPWWLSLMPLEH